jgi:hypothetical protein
LRGQDSGKYDACGTRKLGIEAQQSGGIIFKDFRQFDSAAPCKFLRVVFKDVCKGGGLWPPLFF